jgi:hypothetical protein
MRSRSVVTALIALTAVTASVAARRLGARSRPAVQGFVPARPAVPAPAVRAEPAPAPVAREAVVLTFTRPAVVEQPAPAPAAPARCGDSGGRTKAGAPCAGRATSAGRCHHHRLAA